MRHGSLFAGLGCWNYAADELGWETMFNCEKNKFCQTILKYYWPNAEMLTDINETDFTKYANKINVLSGSYPCQPFSVAGKRKGSEDDRHLWPQMLRAIREISPLWVCYENVPGISHIENGMVFEQVSLDLEAQGYETAPALIIPACAKDAVHRRDRIWIVAYAGSINSALPVQQWRQDKEENNDADWKTRNVANTGCRDTQQCGHVKKIDLERNGKKECTNQTGRSNSNAANTRFQRQAEHEQQAAGIEQCIADATDTTVKGLERGERQKYKGRGNGFTYVGKENWLEAATRLCSVDDGTAGRLEPFTVPKKRGGFRTLTDKQTRGRWRTESLRGYGNAIYWSIAYEIFKAIEATSKI